MTGPDSSEVADRAEKIAEMEAWLRRLPGRYRIGGEVITTERKGSGVRGDAFCTAIGDGPGVQCVINATWMPLYNYDNTPAQANYFETMQPALMLFGIDPKELRIKFLYTNDRGIGTGYTGVLGSGMRDRMTALRWGPCEIKYYCFLGVNIVASPTSDVVTMEFGLLSAGMTLRLSRQP